MISASARCAQHTEVEAANVCARCGAFLCDACVRNFERKPVCEACEVLLLDGPPSPWAIAAKNTMLVAWFVFVVCSTGTVLRQTWMTPGVFGATLISIAAGVLSFVELVSWGTPRGRRIARGVLAAMVFHFIATVFAFAMISISFIERW